MRVQVYSEELTPDVLQDIKHLSNGKTYHGVRFILATPDELLTHGDSDDDRTAVTFWVEHTLPDAVALKEIFMAAVEECDSIVDMIHREGSQDRLDA